MPWRGVLDLFNCGCEIMDGVAQAAASTKEDTYWPAIYQINY